MSNFRNCKKLDIFPIIPKLYIHKQDDIKSCLGTILTIIFSFFSISFLGNNFFQTFKMKFYSNSFNLETKQVYSLPTTKYPFFLRFIDKNGQPIQNIEKIMKIEAFYKPKEEVFVKSLEEQFVFRETRLGNCDRNEFLDEFDNLKTGNITDLFLNFRCAIPIKEPEINNDNSSSTYLETENFQGYKFTKCRNNTKSNITCLDQKTIDTQIDEMAFIWAHIDYDIFHSQINNPFQPKIIQETYYFNTKFIKKFTVTKKQVIYTDEIGSIFEYYTEYINYLYDSTDILPLDLNPRYPNLFSMIFLESSGKRDSHLRRYKKLIETLTESFAFIKSMQFVCRLLIGLLFEKVYFQKLINIIFKFDLIELDNKNNSEYEAKFKQLKDQFKNQNERTFFNWDKYKEKENVYVL